MGNDKLNGFEERTIRNEANIAWLRENLGGFMDKYEATQKENQRFHHEILGEIRSLKSWQDNKNGQVKVYSGVIALVISILMSVFL